MTRVVVNFKGKKKKVGCLGCAIEKGEISDKFVVLKTKYFAVEQDFEIPIPGFLILRTRRHIRSIEEFNKCERKEFIQVLIDSRNAQRKVLKVETIYLHQEEDTSHHFHVWMFPRYEWMDNHGTKIESVRPIMEYARNDLKTSDNVKSVEESITKLKNYFKKVNLS